MRHAMSYRKLGRTSGHRAAMFRNQLASMIQHERIVTTLPKAKELRPILEKLVTLAREDSVHNRRQAVRQVQDESLVQRLFTTIAPRFNDRPGGYTRIIKLGPRRGDGAETAILEFVDFELKAVRPAAPAPKAKKPGKQARPAAGEEGETAAEEAPKKKKAAPKKAAPKKAAPKKQTASKKAATRKGGSKGSKRGS
ncbi:MAG TPA: 50S ribosomal protein L17 [Thermoanaerobaculia bacterium]|nr:50S ribosomal protein L17 [Thermoanaerobaculia bacterium]